MKVKIINRSNNELPAYQTIDSAGMDLRAFLDTPLTLQSLERKIVPTGLSIELPTGYEAQIRPRSGLSYKRGLTLVNAPGTIDADYRGEIGILMINLSQEVQTINSGDRVAQMVIAKYEKIDWENVELLSDTDRGAGGFGSTGKK